MTIKDPYPVKPIDLEAATPFESAEEAWFWFIQAQGARNEGARFTAGLGLYRRPCEPVDILRVLDSLHRNRRLVMDHLLVLRHYGRRQIAPDSRRVKEMRAHELWSEALERIEPILIRKGIVAEKKPLDFWAHKNWVQDAVVYAGGF